MNSPKIIIKTTEKKKILIILLMLLLISAGYTVGWAAFIAISLKRLGWQSLPYAYVTLNITALLGTLYYISAADRMARHKLLKRNLQIYGTLILISRFILTLNQGTEGVVTPLLILFWLFILVAEGGFGYISMQIWVIISDSFTPSQGRKLYQLFTTSSLLGAIVGSIVLNSCVNAVGVENLLILWGLASLSLIPLLGYYQREYGKEMYVPPNGETIIKKNLASWLNISGLKQAFFHLCKSKNLKTIALIMFLFCLVDMFQNFIYNRMSSDTFPSENSLSRFLTYYIITFNVVAIVLQLSFQEKVFTSLGGFRGFYILPIITIFGFFLLTFSFGFWQVLLLHFMWDVIAWTFQWNTFRFTSNAILPAFRGRIRGLFEGIIKPLGALIGGVLLLILVQSPFHFLKSMDFKTTTQLLSILAISLTLIWFLACFKGRDFYIKELINNVRRGNWETRQIAIELLEEKNDPVAFEALLSFLREPQYEGQDKLTTMRTLTRLNDIKALTPISIFLDNTNPLLRIEAIRTIGSFKSLQCYGIAHDFFLKELEKIFRSDPDSSVRLEAGFFMIDQLSKDDVPRFLKKILKNQDPVTRLFTIQTINKLNVPFMELMLKRYLNDEDAAVRAEVVIALWRVPEYQEHTFEVLRQLVHSNIPHEKQRGLRALFFIVDYPLEFISLARECLKDADLHVRALAGLLLLTFLQEEAETTEGVLTVIQGVLCDNTYSDIHRQEFFSLCIFLNDFAKDYLIITILTLSKGHGGEIARRGIDSLGPLIWKVAEKIKGSEKQDFFVTMQSPFPHR